RQRLVDHSTCAMTGIYRDGSYLDQNPDWHEGDAKWKADQIEELFRRNGLAPRSVVEIGCGAGGILRELAMRSNPNCAYAGYEISEQAYQLCTRQPTRGVTYHHGDLLAAPPDVTFDVSLAIDVFEHVDDYIGFLRALHGRARQHVFHIPLDLSVQTVLRSSPILKGRSLVGHLHYFTKETALATLTDTGYEVVDHFYTGSSLDAPNRRLRPRLIKFPRRVAFRLNRDLTVRVLGGWSLLVLARTAPHRPGPL
ncbi:MAG: class I SAM-dependent methyltransferase, partial [Acidimicrobiales bacterium]